MGRRATTDFTSTSPQHSGNYNAPLVVTRAVVLRVFRTLVGKPIPLNEGCLAPLDIVAPEESLLNPRAGAAVIAVNTEVSQSACTALYGALGVVAASQGTMNDFIWGNHRFRNDATVAGGTGAGPGFAGCDSVQSHMTNIRMTDPEVLKKRFPVRLERLSIGQGSGGAGQFAGATASCGACGFCHPSPSPHFAAAGCRPGSARRGAVRGRWAKTLSIGRMAGSSPCPAVRNATCPQGPCSRCAPPAAAAGAAKPPKAPDSRWVVANLRPAKDLAAVAAAGDVSRVSQGIGRGTRAGNMENEAFIRLGVFTGVFVVLAGLERLAPRKVGVQPRSGRWVTNLALVVINTLTVRALALALPILAVAAAVDAGNLGLGLFNRLDWPVWAEVALTVLILDLAIWLQHLVTHKVPLFWRFHRVHHADRDFDVTTALRFHPVEIAASALLKVGLVYLIGPSAFAVVLFEILLNATAMFNHANLRLPSGLDRALRLLLVTPDMHRVHHSAQRDEHDSNYGFSLSVWDRIFRTYVPQPKAGHEAMTVGLEWQDDRPMKLGWALWLPFRR